MMLALATSGTGYFRVKVSFSEAVFATPNETDVDNLISAIVGW